LPQKAERFCAIAGLPMHLRELAKGHRQIALPFGIAGVGLRSQ
jgi:hypothetical protein